MKYKRFGSDGERGKGKVGRKQAKGAQHTDLSIGTLGKTVEEVWGVKRKKKTRGLIAWRTGRIKKQRGELSSLK